MTPRLWMGFSLALLFAIAFDVSARTKPARHKSHTESERSEEIESATRLQIFLDRANFSPGAITGRYNEFTLKALSLYRESRGEPSPSPSKKPNAVPDMNGIDLKSVDPVFMDYTVTDADLQNIGPVPESVAPQAKLKFLPYRDAAEAIAEKFHCDAAFFKKLNHAKTFKPGDRVKVPNVEPFDLAAVKDIEPGSEMNTDAANDLPDDAATPKEDQNQPGATASPITTSINIDTKTNMLSVFDAEKLVAAYPVTIGSAQTASPIGDWKVKGIAKLPRFRHDKAMLKYGKRSGDFHMLPPGPNSPVGVMWIALNKKGIGLHGTNEPDTIGHAASHGCVRLANWDAVRLAQKIKAGVPVGIQ